LKTIFLKGLDEDPRRSLDLTGKGDVSQIELSDIVELCRNFSQTHRGICKSSLLRGSNEIGKLREEIENLKTDILV